jgi:polyphosphate kinase
LTCDPDIGYDVVNLFHYLTGYAPDQPYEKVMVAPRDMRKAFDRLIRQEIAHQKTFGNGRVVAKMNALDDLGMIRRLYIASQAGVQIDLNLGPIPGTRPDFLFLQQRPAGGLHR